MLSKEKLITDLLYVYADLQEPGHSSACKHVLRLRV